MAIDFLTSAQSVRSNGISSKPTTILAGPKIQNSKEVDGIEIRMLPPLIKDNHTARIFPFPGYSKLYCLTIVVSDITNQLAGSIDLKAFPRIGDNEYLPINKTIFYWQSSSENDRGPNQVHVFCSILKSKKGLRESGKILTEIKADENYKSIVGDLGRVAKDIAQFNVITDTVVQLAGVVGKYLGAVEDKPIGTVINSYTTLHGDFDTIGISPLIYHSSDSDFTFEVIVRDQSANSKAATSAAAMPLAPGTAASKPGHTEEKVTVDMQTL
ncbi:MAG: hypothetical protein ABI415_08355 [Flavitalea sp.]